MTNFSSFFPVAAAGGGGGFTKMKKISTNDSTDETTDKLQPNIGLRSSANNLGASLTTSVYYSDDGGFDFTAEDALVGYKYTSTSGNTSYIHTITASAANTGENDNFNITMSVSDGASSIRFNWWAADPAKTMLAPPKTINPATDLGLSDGDSIGFLLAGGNATGILRGTAIISTASTDLVITPGLSSGTASTITGGLTLSSADGSLSNSIGYLSTVENSGYSSFMRTRVSAGQGIDGYGVGQQFSGTQTQGYGGYGKDGAVLLFY